MVNCKGTIIGGKTFILSWLYYALSTNRDFSFERIFCKECRNFHDSQVNRKVGNNIKALVRTSKKAAGEHVARSYLRRWRYLRCACMSLCVLGSGGAAQNTLRHSISRVEWQDKAPWVTLPIQRSNVQRNASLETRERAREPIDILTMASTVQG